jgi:predicted RNase H-like HicB family nuclease
VHCFINIGIKKMNIKFVVERHYDGFIAYPLGIQGIVAGQGNSYLEALNDAKSALKFHIETFGKEVLESETNILEAFIEEEAFI